MGFQFPASLTPDFRITLQEGDRRWNVHCSGILDAANAAALLQPELLRLHAAAIEAKIPVIGLALESVEYINSSGLKSFMAWFLAAANESDFRYTIEVTYDPSRSWQQLSLNPMERLAPRTVKLVSLAAPGAKARDV
jgi:hypothetical protein